MRQIDHSPIPREEIDLFRQLDVKVVFDVGARADFEYLNVKPTIELYAFEPNTIFFQQLESHIKGREGVHLYNYGLSDEDALLSYNWTLQAFEGGESESTGGEFNFPVKTLDWFVKENNIKQIDFLKIDAEGYEYKILRGGKDTIPLCKFIQYEHWVNQQQFHDLLEKDFEMYNIGFRNVLCINRKLVSEQERKRLADYIFGNSLKDLV